jgi:hypothetical protein
VAGVNQRNRNVDAEGGNAVFDKIVSKFLTILEFRLKKNKAIVIQIFIAMMSTESESPQVISTLQEMKFALDEAVQISENPS